LVVNGSPSLTEALNQYVTKLKTAQQRQGQQELQRFIQWCGRQRSVTALTPSEIAGYAESAGMWGTDSTQKLKPVKSFLSYLKENGMVSVSLAPHLKVSRAKKGSRRVYARTVVESTQLSAEGYANLQSRLDMLYGERTKVVGDIQRAMADKDFRENAPLDAAKERQGLIESNIRELEGVLAHTVVVSDQAATQDRKVRIGKRVTLVDANNGNEVSYTLVDPREADPNIGKISNASPVGKALLDKTIGEEVHITVPRGTLHYKILEIGG
jgi:transcription elongation factor GreA